jgi:O-methyltransferase involved in polyketide biosynthesis
VRAHKASATARVIAAACLMHHSQFPQDVRVSPEMDSLCWQLLQSCRSDRALAASARWAPTQQLWRRIERATLPGVVSHYLNRKARIEAEVRKLLTKNTAAEVIVLGAGLDTLAARLAPAFPGVVFIEVDHPATQGVKREGLTHAGKFPNNLTLEACDFQTALPAALLKKTDVLRVVIAEGLLMYFDTERVKQILRAALEGSPTRVLFTYMEARDDGAIGFEPHSKLIGLWLRIKGEPFKWGIKFAEVDALAKSLHADLISHARAEDFSNASPPSSLRGENLASFQHTS